MSEQEIIKKAKNLGINPNSNPNQTALQNIAMELGMNPNNYDIDEIVRQLESMDIEQLEPINKEIKNIGYNEETSNSMPSKNISRTRTEQLNNQTSSLNERNKRFQNKINNAKSRFSNLPHPKQTIKDNVVNNATKKVGSTTGTAIKKGASTGVKALVSLIKKNPYVLLTIGGVVLLLIILMLLFSAGAANTENVDTYCDTLDSNNFSMKSTPFEQIEFTDKVTAYFNQDDNFSSCNYYLADANVVDSIYDISLENEISPEYTIINAIINDCSSEMDYSYNNLWNLVCESSYCQFETLEEGITYFANANKYNKLEDSFYDIEDEEELNAAIREVVNLRDNIFYDGNYDFDCTSSIANRNYEYYQKGAIFSQKDPNWANKYLGNSSSSMGGYGCAVTSIANGISAYVTNLSVEYFDAGVFLDKLNAGGCFTETGAIYWSCSAITAIAPSVSLSADIRGIKEYSNVEKINYFNRYDPAEYFLVVGYNNEQTSSHYVVFAGLNDNETYNSIDPAPGAMVIHAINDINQIVVYKYR